MPSFLLENPALLAIAIFLARVTDVSLGTLRTILVFRSYRFLSAAIGFFEVLIWILAASQVLNNLDRWYLAIAYAGGFATGNVLGIQLERVLAMGSELVRVVSPDPTVRLAARLRDAGYEVIEIPARDRERAVEVLLVVERRRRVPQLLRDVDQHDPDAILTVSDIKDNALQVIRRSRNRVGQDLRGVLKRK